jgi:Flp pilus assembly protein TadG
MRRGERGNTLVETSLVITLFVLLVAGIFDLGRVLYIEHTLEERVRAAARFAALHPDDESAIRRFVLASDAAPPLPELQPAMCRVTRGTGGVITVAVENYPVGFLLGALGGSYRASARATLPVAAPLH